MAIGDPERFDHTLIIGDTYQPAVVTVMADEDTPKDITGASAEVQIKDADATLLLSPTVTITDAAAGQLTWASTPAETADLSPQRARFTLRVTFASGEVRTLAEGDVKIRRGGIS